MELFLKIVHYWRPLIAFSAKLHRRHSNGLYIHLRKKFANFISQKWFSFIRYNKVFYKVSSVQRTSMTFYVCRLYVVFLCKFLFFDIKVDDKLKLAALSAQILLHDSNISKIKTTVFTLTLSLFSKIKKTNL